MNEYTEFKRILIDKTIKNFEKNFFEPHFFNDSKSLISFLKEIIPNNSVIGYGGSRSLEEVGFFDHFTPDKYPNLLDRRVKGLSQEEKIGLYNKSLTADFYLSSANGVSVDGDIVLIDKWGNRNAAITFGPKKRIIIIGKNKIERSLNEAINRAKNVAAVLNNIRFNTENPCTKNGHCFDCNSENRLCSITTIVSRCQPPKSILVLLVDENLGY